MRYREHQRYRDVEWIDALAKLRLSPISGRGLFARALIKAGEPVVIWGGVVFTKAEVNAGKAAPGSTVAIGEDLFLGSPVETYDREWDNLGDFINHSCDPTLWMQDEVTLVARRDIYGDEELTADYAMWEADESHLAPWECRCGSPLCRGRVTGRDWRLPELQERYRGHFSPFINERIRRLEEASKPFGLFAALDEEESV